MSSKTVLITSAAEHASPAVAHLLGKRGWKLVLQGADSALVQSLRTEGVQLEVSNEDLCTRESAFRCVQEAMQAFGSLDAAWVRTGYVTSEVNTPFLSSSAELWEALKLHNLEMVVNVLRAVLPGMVAAGQGQIVVSTSATGLQPSGKAPLYSATRAAAVALVRALGLEFADRGVAINAIATSHIDVPAFRRAAGIQDEETRRRSEQAVPMKRLGSADELAAFAEVLLDGRTRFQTGQCFSFSGGMTP